MGKHFFASGDKNVDFADRAWTTNSFVFRNIFDRVASLFDPDESLCKEKCYEDTGIDGIDLDHVDKDCFNIFCLHCKEALNNFSETETPTWSEKEFPNQPEKWAGLAESFVFEWKEIVKRLELDIRYDAEWIKDYRRNKGELG